MTTNLPSRRSFMLSTAVAATGAAAIAGCANGYGDETAAPHAEYRAVSASGPQGSAPNTRSHQLAEGAYMLVLADGDELFTALDDFARNEKVVAASYTAIGALRDVQLAWYDLNRKQFKVIRVDEQVEAVSVTGDIGVSNGKPAVHSHLVVSRSDGTTVAGHLLYAIASPTIEVSIRTYPTPLLKHHDEHSGLTLFN